MLDHFITKVKYQKLIKLGEIQENKNNRKFKIKTKFDLILKITSIRTLKSSDTEKMKLFKTSCLITVNHDLELTSSMLFRKHSSKDVSENKIKKTKITSD